MRKIITISREFGAGGGELGKKLADALGYEFYSKEIILRAAYENDIDIESMEKWDEKVPANFGFAQSLFDFYNKPLSEKLFEAQKKVIMEIGEKENCVILGRNANSILKEFDSTLHVFISADPYWRMERLMTKMPNYSPAKISERIRAVDKSRKKYCAHYTNTEFGNADYYDICLNTSHLGIDVCVEILKDLVLR